MNDYGVVSDTTQPLLPQQKKSSLSSSKRSDPSTSKVKSSSQRASSTATVQISRNRDMSKQLNNQTGRNSKASNRGG